MPLDEAFVVMSGFNNGREPPVHGLSGTAGSAKSEVPAAKTAVDPSHGILTENARGAVISEFFLREGGT